MIPNKTQRDQWRADATNPSGMTSAVGEYTPAEFVYLLDAVDGLEAQHNALLDALTQCEVMMDCARMHGVGDLLPPSYREMWVAAHAAAREALAKAKGN